MDLVDATDKTTEVAKCLSSVRITLAANCKVQIVSTPAAGGSFVTAIWGTASQPTYTQLIECPLDAGTAVPVTFPVTYDADDLRTNILTAIQTALNQRVYGSGKPSGLASIAAANGVVSFGTTAYIYAVKASTVALTMKAVSRVTGTGLTSPQIAASVGAACDITNDGRFGVIIGDIKLCPLCPAGTTGDGNGCTACTAGTASNAVGAKTCGTNCARGTYSGDGLSDCLPCPAGTYTSAAGESQCLECPTDSYSWLPGSTACLRCVDGIPKCVAGYIDGTVGECSNVQASSAGYQILSTLSQIDVHSVNGDNKCELAAGNYALPAYASCASWRTGSVTLQLALAVAGDCSITIRPITDTACSEEGAVTGIRSSTYTYNNIVMRAYYTTTKTVRSLMPSGSTNSFLLGMDQSGANVAVKFWAATTDPSAAATLPAACTSTASTIGGQVALLPASPATSCPAGSYIPSGELYCAAW